MMSESGHITVRLMSDVCQFNEITLSSVMRRRGNGNNESNVFFNLPEWARK